MTRIAIFCDGTWNSPKIPETTHVHKLQKAVRHRPDIGQVSVYFPGIGTDDRFDGPVRRLVNKYGGGAFGWGLDAKVKQAYQFIAQVYQPGDEIYLFGFSRGAFTARSVAGMIRKCGIAADTTPEGINAAFKLYRKKGPRNRPDMDHIQAARQKISPNFATSDEDLRLRGDDSVLVRIAYLGVWDTVGARGVPVSLLGPIAALWNSQYKFHDMALSSLVRSARHAVAVDERRVFFKPALWDNLDGEKGLNKGDDTNPLRAYQQTWFVGNHAIVGGSARAQALAAFPLMWVLEGAGRLSRDPSVVFPPTRADALADAVEIQPKWGLLARWRKGPTRAHHIHPSVRARWQGRSDYRPENLSQALK
ncbi:MAG: DUF2235 domain-containing protein [Paracoccaceae bacterium]